LKKILNIFRVNPKVHAQKRLLILDTPEHVDSENIKFKIGFRNSAYQATNFFQSMILKIQKKWLKVAKMSHLKTRVALIELLDLSGIAIGNVRVPTCCYCSTT
jgi:hypothetical protein